MAALLGACGGESSSDANEAAGKYPVRVVAAAFPTAQHLGQTSLLRLGVENSGKKTLPALTVTFSIAGQAGRDSTLPFGIRDPQPGLAQPDRPVWVLSHTYPRLAGSDAPGGATTSSPKTFSFGPLKSGETTEAIWKLSAVKAGRYTLRYGIDAGLSGTAKAVSNGVAPGGTFVAEIAAKTPDVVVTDSGEVVEIGKRKNRGGSAPE